jgi:hypothetical protein
MLATTLLSHRRRPVMFVPSSFWSIAGIHVCVTFVVHAQGFARMIAWNLWELALDCHFLSFIFRLWVFDLACRWPGYILVA